MPRRIRIDFATDDIHRVRNFGEDLYRMSLTDRAISCSIDEIDRATTVIFATIRPARRARRTIAEIEKLLARHGFAGVASITVLPPAANP